MANPTYGAAFNELKALGATITATPKLAGTNATSAIFISPEIRDISYTSHGDIKEFRGVDGEYEAISASGFYYEITFTILPMGTTRANALKGCGAFDVGTPFTIANAPTIRVDGHTLEASPRVSDLLNGVMYLQSANFTMSVEKETSGTMTFKKYPSLSSTTVL
jgi:hypothetical protein